MLLPTEGNKALCGAEIELWVRPKALSCIASGTDPVLNPCGEVGIAPWGALAGPTPSKIWDTAIWDSLKGCREDLAGLIHTCELLGSPW